MSSVYKIAIYFGVAIIGALAGVWLVGAFMQHSISPDGRESVTLVAIGGTVMRFTGSWVMWVTLLCSIGVPIWVASLLFRRGTKRSTEKGS